MGEGEEVRLEQRLGVDEIVGTRVVAVKRLNVRLGGGETVLMWELL